MPQNAFFLRTHNLLVSPKVMQRHFLFTLHPLSTVIFAVATVLAFVLLRDSRFNFHCYTQREATPTQKSARKCAATSRDFFHERCQPVLYILPLLGDSGGVVNSLDVCLASLKSLGCFYFWCVLSSQWKAVTVNL